MANKRLLLSFMIIFLLILWGCSENTVTKSDDESTESNSDYSATVAGETDDSTTVDDSDSEEDLIDYGDYDIDESSIVNIELADDATTVDSSGVSIDGNLITIYNEGTYQVTGTLSDGQIVVDLQSSSSIDKSTSTTEDEVVKLILNGVNINCSTNAPLYAKEAEKTIIILAEGTENYLSDGASYVDEDDANAALYCKTDLLIYGEGTLNVTGNYNDGITGKDGVVISSGTYNVTAVDDGIRGKDYLEIEDGTFVIESGGDGLKSDNDDDTELGYISILTGTFDITAAGDGMAAETDIYIDAGEYTITSGGGSNQSVGDDESAKAIKAGDEIVILDGEYILSSAEDGIHSDNLMEINGGTFEIAAADDGFHSELTLEINGGDITVTESYEGIESVNLTINGGNIHVESSDDGINAAGANSGNTLDITGGYIYVNAQGDGIDVNGSITMSDGVLIVNGPTSNGNGAIDYDATFKMTGGFLVAAGSSGMAQAPSSSSSINSVLYSSRNNFSAGTIFHIETSSGDDVLTFAPVKKYRSVVLASASLEQGSSYKIYTGGSSTGTNTDGLYEGGEYSGGTSLTSFTVSGTVTKINR